ncbi:MAG: hypothetical protein ACOX7J_00255 [Bacillota bacterium]|jgi:hypothetical protein
MTLYAGVETEQQIRKKISITADNISQYFMINGSITPTYTFVGSGDVFTSNLPDSGSVDDYAMMKLTPLYDMAISFDYCCTPIDDGGSSFSLYDDDGNSYESSSTGDDIRHFEGLLIVGIPLTFCQYKTGEIVTAGSYFCNMEIEIDVMGMAPVIAEITKVPVGIDGAVVELSEMYAGIDGVNQEIFSAATKVHNPVVSLTFTGTYATGTYFTEEDCGTAVLPDGRVVLYMKNGSNRSSYENLFFNAASVSPVKVNIDKQTFAEYNAANSYADYYCCILSGITTDVDMSITMDYRNSSYDYVQCTIVMEQSDYSGEDVIFQNGTVVLSNDDSGYTYFTDYLMAQNSDKVLLLLTPSQTTYLNPATSATGITLYGKAYVAYLNRIGLLVLSKPSFKFNLDVHTTSTSSTNCTVTITCTEV